MRSGSEVVGAATIPPVGAYVSAFSVISDRSTASRQRPRYVDFSLHARHARSAAASALDDAHDVGALGPWGHAIDDAHRALVVGKLGLEHERARPIRAARARAAARGDAPAAVVARAEQRREARRRAEARQAQPV